MVRAEYPKGRIEHYVGAEGEEHMVRAEFAKGHKFNGAIWCYEGANDKKRLVRVECPKGHKCRRELDGYAQTEGAKLVVTTDAKAPLAADRTPPRARAPASPGRRDLPSGARHGRDLRVNATRQTRV